MNANNDAHPEINLPWWRHDRPWGFRFSLLDGVVMAAGVALIASVRVAFPDVGIVTALTLGHFLLFCNTFRIGGERSTIWVVVLIANSGAWVYADQFTWARLIASQLVLTCVLIVNCLWSRNYNGLACEHVNPHGYRDGALQEGAFTRRVLRRMGVPCKAIELLTGRKLPELSE